MINARAFTLTELGVTLAAGALSCALIVPALAASRTNAHSAIAHANLKLLTDAQLAHASSNDLWLAGPNTTGWQSIVTNGNAVVGDTTPSTPTQTHDLISPILGDALGFSPNRAERMMQIFKTIACPRATRYDDLLFSGGSVSDLADFSNLFSKRPFLQVSYLAPAPFHHRPPGSHWHPDPESGAHPLGGFGQPVSANPDYLPRLDHTGPPSEKACIADGTRYIFTSGGIGGGSVKIDIDIAPSVYANFLSGTPIFDESVAYGRRSPQTSAGENVEISMRFPTGDSAFGRGMHTARFDGSVIFITAEEAWTNASLWYPSGSTFTDGGAATPESRALYNPGDILP